MLWSFCTSCRKPLWSGFTTDVRSEPMISTSHCDAEFFLSLSCGSPGLCLPCMGEDADGCHYGGNLHFNMCVCVCLWGVGVGADASYMFPLLTLIIEPARHLVVSLIQQCDDNCQQDLRQVTEAEEVAPFCYFLVPPLLSKNHSGKGWSKIILNLTECFPTVRSSGMWHYAVMGTNILE
jgi:hypothetical protein